MQIKGFYQNFSEIEKDWIVLAAALRPDATVDDLINSFLAHFPDRAEQDEIPPGKIRKILTSRINDMLYRKERCYAQTIDDLRREYQKPFTSTFAVINPLSLLNHYERVFTNPNSKPSDVFKAIQAAETLKERIVQEEIDRQQAEREKEAKFQRRRLSIHFNATRFDTFYDQLPENLRDEIDDYDTPKLCEVLEREGLTEALEKINSSLEIQDIEALSDTAILEMSQEWGDFLYKMSFDELQDTLFHSLDKSAQFSILCRGMSIEENNKLLRDILKGQT